MRRRHRIIKNFRKAREHRSVAMQAMDLIAHKLKLNTHWEDYYRHGFYRQDMPWSEKALYVSDYGSYHWPWEGNSLKFDRLFIRRSLWKSVVAAEGLPTPRMLLNAGRTTLSIRRRNWRLNWHASMCRFLQSLTVAAEPRQDGRRQEASVASDDQVWTHWISYRQYIRGRAFRRC